MYRRVFTCRKDPKSWVRIAIAGYSILGVTIWLPGTWGLYGAWGPGIPRVGRGARFRACKILVKDLTTERSSEFRHDLAKSLNSKR